jgi:DNA-directed RNA polymerase subunit D
MKTILKISERRVFSAEMSERLANAIRRSVFSIPVLAIDELEIEKNDTALYDETLAHRIGLVPLKMPKSVKEGEEIKLTLSSNQPGYLYSKDIKGDLEVVYDKIPLTLLAEGHGVKATCTARLGLGKDHAKFSPGIMTYRNASEVTIPKKYKEAVSKIFPQNEIKEKGDKIVIKDNLDKPLSDFCEGLCLKDNEEFETKDTKELIVSIESFGQISSEEIFKQASKILKEELKDLGKSFK